MLFDYKEALRKYKNDYMLNKALQEKSFFKIERGIYSDGESNYTDIELVLKKYDEAVLVKDSALYLIGFLETPPGKIHLGTARNALRIKDRRIIQHYYSGFEENKATFYGWEINRILSKSNVHCYRTDNGNEIRLLNQQALFFDLLRDRRKYSDNDYSDLLRKFRDCPMYCDLDYDFEENMIREGMKPDEEYIETLSEMESNAFRLKWKKEWEKDWD